MCSQAQARVANPAQKELARLAKAKPERSRAHAADPTSGTFSKTTLGQEADEESAAVALVNRWTEAIIGSM